MSESDPERFDNMFMAVAQQCDGGIHEVGLLERNLQKEIYLYLYYNYNMITDHDDDIKCDFIKLVCIVMYFKIKDVVYVELNDRSL